MSKCQTDNRLTHFKTECDIRVLPRIPQKYGIGGCPAVRVCKCLNSASTFLSNNSPTGLSTVEGNPASIFFATITTGLSVVFKYVSMEYLQRPPCRNRGKKDRCRISLNNIINTAYLFVKFADACMSFKLLLSFSKVKSQILS